MTPLAINTAAAPEAAALFPLPAAGPVKADCIASVSSSFGDLLAASFGQQEAAATAVTDGAPASKGVSVADTWFATLTIDFNALNASLDAEETCAASANGSSTPASLVDDSIELSAEDEGAEEDAAEALMALMVPVPVPVPLAALQLAATSATSNAPVTSLAELPSLSADQEIGSSDQGIGQAQIQSTSVTQAAASQPIESEPLAPQLGAENVRDGAASAINVGREQDAPVPSVKAAPVMTTAQATATDSAQQPAESAPASANETTTIEAQAAETPALRATGPRVTTRAQAPERQTEAQAQVSEALASASSTPLAAPQQGQAIDVTPAVQPIERPRDAMAAKLAELSGIGQSGVSETPVSAAANQMADAQSESHSQQSGAQDAFGLSALENATPARAAEGSSPAPVFTMVQPHASVAAPAAAHAAEMPHAPTLANTPAPENIGRLIESMRVQLKDGIQEATVHLKPEHLGEVTISVRVERGAVSAIVHTDTAAVQQWLEAQEGKLRSGLSEQGLHLQRFYVHRDGSQQQQEQPKQQNPSARRYRQQGSDQALRFEVMV